MCGESQLKKILKGMTPKLNPGVYVFVSVASATSIPRKQIIGEFREKEGITIIMEQANADSLGLPYRYIASWITLTIHSSLDAIGLTAAISTTLAENEISCNIVAAYYHDHIFVAKKDEERALKALVELSEKAS